MKKLLFLLLCLLALTVGTAVYGESPSAQENAQPQDSKVDVIGWFNKNDTVTYWIRQSTWRIIGNDTVRIASSATKVRINVVDSMAEGYKMEYTFLEFPTINHPDSAPASAVENLQNKLTTILTDKLVGTTVQFETNDCGKITGFSNPGQIKKRAKSIFDSAINEISKLPEVQKLKEKGMNIKDFAKKVDTDAIVEDYLKELNMLFTFHGLSFPAGETSEHEDATDSTFENTTYNWTFIDPDDETYHIDNSVVNILTQKAISKAGSGFAGTIKDENIRNIFSGELNALSKFDGTFEDHLIIDYLPNGWPYCCKNQEITTIGLNSHIKQTVIDLESYTFAQ